MTFEISEESKNGLRKKQTEDGDQRRERGDRQRDRDIRDPGDRRHRSVPWSGSARSHCVSRAEDDERREKRRSSKPDPDHEDHDHHERRGHHSSSESRKHERHSESRKSQGELAGCMDRENVISFPICY